MRIGKQTETILSKSVKTQANLKPVAVEIKVIDSVSLSVALCAHSLIRAGNVIR